MLKKILLAYDGSKGAQAATRTAAELAQRFEAEVTLLTIGGPLLSAATLNEQLPHMNQHEYERIAEEGLAILTQKQVRSHKHLVWLDPADQILQEASNGNYDLIVMGHRGAFSSIRGDVGLLGSVAIKVINHAPCSVYIVRSSFEDNTFENATEVKGEDAQQ
jgi:nucleotide-binding universal stress UspA family protein